MSRSWSSIRAKLEQEYLAPSLRGRITYFATCYHNTHDDDEGRAAVRLDGREILKSNFFAYFENLWPEIDKAGPEEDWREVRRQAEQKVLAEGCFYQKSFYRAFAEFDGQDIQTSLRSGNALVRMFALLDRRTGRRTLLRLADEMRKAPRWLQMFYIIRLEAEQMPLPAEFKGESMKTGILFDLDGTLWDSSAEVTHAWNKAIREQTARTEQFTTDDMHRFMGKTMDVIAGMMFPMLPAEEREGILRLCSAEEYSYLREHPAHIFGAVRETLSALARTHTLGIVSNCQDGYIEIFLDQCGFSDIFSDCECEGRTGKSKGQNIRLVMARQGIGRCIYVGDTQGDADAAKEAGIPFVHAAYGFGTADASAAAISDISELTAVAEELLG